MRYRKQCFFRIFCHLLAALGLSASFCSCAVTEDRKDAIALELSAPQEIPRKEAVQEKEADSTVNADPVDPVEREAAEEDAFNRLTDLVHGHFSVLINRDHLLDKTYVPDTLVKVKEHSTSSIRLKESGILADATAVEALNEMMAAAEADGVEGFFLVSVYRTYDEQQKLWNKKVRQDRTYGSDQSIPLITAYPGTSEHQLGLAFDITSVKQRAMSSKFADTPQGVWLNANCHAYGFILRYPQGKEHITNIVYEPWHFRYVGKELSTYLTAHALTLEEFYEVLPENGLDSPFNRGLY